MSIARSTPSPDHPARRVHIDRATLLAILLLLLAGLAYVQQLGQYLFIDDEGSYAYAAWRISLGEMPYRDFLSPQMPLFLYWGGLIVRLFGRSFIALRLATIPVMLLAGYLLYAANRELLGRGVALLGLGFFLIEPWVFHCARHFRPEAYMLVFQMAGLYAFILGEKRGRLRYIALAGVAFGLAMLCKLFGALSLAACFLYLLYAWWRERRPLPQVLREGLALGLPALLLVGVVVLVFQLLTPYFIVAIFEHHTMQGAGMPMAERIAKTLAFFGDYIVHQPLALALGLLGAGLLFRRPKALSSLHVWWWPTALGFFALSRELFPRQLVYLTPALATLMAVALAEFLSLQRRTAPWQKAWQVAASIVILGLALVFTLRAIEPWKGADAYDVELKEHDALKLAAIIQEKTNPGDLVMADYPGLNFLAGRRSTYWASGLSGGAAQSGQIRGSALIDEIQHENVALVLINTWGSAHQMISMADFPEFRSYLASHMALADNYRADLEGRQFEIYVRRVGGSEPGGKVTLPPIQGGTIELVVRFSPAGRASGAWKKLWTLVQWQDGAGAWHDVDAWRSGLQGSSDGNGYQVWAVSPSDLGHGPFRWLILRGPQGPQVAASEPFNMPAQPGGTVQVQVQVSP